MDDFLERYADYILDSALGLNEDDILTINTEEDNLHFANILARKVKERNDVGTYLHILENGKSGEMTELFSDYLIEKTPTLFVYLKRWEGYPHFDPCSEDKISARELQKYGMLASPLVLPEPSIPSVSVPVPSAAWSTFLDEDSEDERLTSVIISDFLGLADGNMKEARKELSSIISYDLGNLNSVKGRECRMYTDDGLTDISFRFLKETEFVSSLEKTTSGRPFLPHLFSTSYFRAVDKKTAEGRISITKPFILFGHVIENLSLEFENGRVTSFTAPEGWEEMFAKVFSYDEDASTLAELSIAEEHNRAGEIPLFADSEWDRMRTTHITLGAARAESMKYATEDDAVNAGASWSLLSLPLPVGSDELTITLTDDDGEETVIYSDGVIEDQSI